MSILEKGMTKIYLGSNDGLVKNPQQKSEWHLLYCTSVYKGSTEKLDNWQNNHHYKS